jgi:protein ImuB
MFACIYGQVSSKTADDELESTILVDLAFTFSPLVEQTAVDTVVLDVSGQELLFGPLFLNRGSEEPEIDWVQNLAREIARRAAQTGLKVNVSVGANPDAAIHSARSFKGVVVIPAGDELFHLGSLSIKLLDYSLAEIEEKRAEEIAETFALWGIHTFSDLAQLPLAGVAQRLGQEGIRLQKLAQGRSERRLVLVQSPIGFEQSLELEHPVEELEPLSFILSRLLNQLCANLDAHALATNELRLCLKLEDKTDHERTITLPVPMRNPRTFLRLLLLDIEAQPPPMAIIAVTITAEPIKPRISQTGLFIPLAPEPEKLEVTLARLAKLVGAGNVGSPEPLDTHRPDAFRMKRFTIGGLRKKLNPQSAISNQQCLMGFRVFRPPWPAEVQILRGQPTRLKARSVQTSNIVRGKITRASGPWRSSGEWWRADVWARDEWDVAVADGTGEQSEVLCRIYRNLISEKWFVEGMYD